MTMTTLHQLARESADQAHGGYSLASSIDRGLIALGRHAADEDGDLLYRICLVIDPDSQTPTPRLLQTVTQLLQLIAGDAVATRPDGVR